MGKLFPDRSGGIADLLNLMRLVHVSPEGPSCSNRPFSMPPLLRRSSAPGEGNAAGVGGPAQQSCFFHCFGLVRPRRHRSSRIESVIGFGFHIAISSGWRTGHGQIQLHRNSRRRANSTTCSADNVPVIKGACGAVWIS